MTFQTHLICLSAIYLAPCTSSVCVFKASECTSVFGFWDFRRFSVLWKISERHTHTAIERILVCFWYRCHLSLFNSRNSSHYTPPSVPLTSSHLSVLFTLITFCRLHRMFKIVLGTHTDLFTPHTHTHHTRTHARARTHTHTHTHTQLVSALS